MPNVSPILFLTGNRHKFAEAQTILNAHGIRIARTPAKGTEIQTDSLVAVAMVCAESAYKRLRRPLFVEDSGLFVDSLNGFPGVYSSAAHDTIGCAGILRLLDQQRQRRAGRSASRRLKARALRSARFECAIAYVDSHGTRIFRGTVHGTIASRIFSGKGFGYDPLFIPRGYDKPFSAIPEVKTLLSHRARALQAFAKYLQRRNKR